MMKEMLFAPDGMLGIAIDVDNHVIFTVPGLTVTIAFDPEGLRDVAADFLAAAERVEAGAVEAATAALDRAAGRAH